MNDGVRQELDGCLVAVEPFLHCMQAMLVVFHFYSCTNNAARWGSRITPDPLGDSFEAQGLEHGWQKPKHYGCICLNERLEEVALLLVLRELYQVPGIDFPRYGNTLLLYSAHQVEVRFVQRGFLGGAGSHPIACASAPLSHLPKVRLLHCGRQSGINSNFEGRQGTASPVACRTTRYAAILISHADSARNCKHRGSFIFNNY